MKRHWKFRILWWGLFFAGLIPSLLMNGCSKTALPDSPNILLISLDACRPDHLTPYGYEKDTSPFLNKLAQRGLLFSRAYVNTHGTPSSHATILTGLYQEDHAVFYRDEVLPRVPKRADMIQEILRSNGYLTIGSADGGYVTDQQGFSRGFDSFASKRSTVEAGVRRLLREIRSYYPFEKPLFVFWHTYQIHSPYEPPEKYRNRFGPFKSTFTASSRNLLDHSGKKIDLLTKDDFDLLNGLYDAEIRYVDDQMKILFNELEKLNFFENGLVVITSDHGEEFGEHRSLLHWNKMYEELIRAPLILAGTRIPKGRVIKTAVSSIDIAPTILKFCGLTPPSHMPGQDLLALPEQDDGRFVISQYGGEKYAVIKPPWKLIRTIQPPKMELYHLERDPEERNNRSAAQTGIVIELNGILGKWKKKYSPDLVGTEVFPPLPEERIEELKSLGYLGGH